MAIFVAEYTTNRGETCYFEGSTEHQARRRALDALRDERLNLTVNCREVQAKELANIKLSRY